MAGTNGNGSSSATAAPGFNEAIGLNDIIQHGIDNNVQTWKIADALKSWRDDAVEFGRSKAAEADPEKYWNGVAALDRDVDAALTALRLEEVNRRVGSLGYASPEERLDFTERFASGDMNPFSTALGSGPQARDGASEQMVAASVLNVLNADNYFNDTNLAYGMSIDVGGNTLARFALRDAGAGKVDAFVDFDKGGKEIIALKDITADDLQTRIENQKAKIETARKKVADATSALDTASKSAIGGESAIGAGIAASEQLKYANADLAEQEAVLAGLQSKDGRKFALQLDLQDELKKPEHEGKVGDKNLWGDFVRGVQKGVISSRLTMERIDQALLGMDKQGNIDTLRAALRDISIATPGSSARMFQGGKWNEAVVAAAESGGEMADSVVPTGALSRLGSAGLRRMFGQAITGEIGAAASAASMAPTSFGLSYADMLDKADAIARINPELAKKLRSRADLDAVMQATIDFGTEMMTFGHAPFLAKGGFWRRTARLPGQMVGKVGEEVAAGGLERGIKQPITREGTPEAHEPVTKGSVVEALAGGLAAGPVAGLGVLPPYGSTGAPSYESGESAPPPPTTQKAPSASAAAPPPPPPEPEAGKEAPKPPPPTPPPTTPEEFAKIPVAPSVPPQTAAADADILRESAAGGLLLLGGPEADPKQAVAGALSITNAQGEVIQQRAGEMPAYAPESADTLAWQIDALVDPAKPKTAVLFEGLSTEQLENSRIEKAVEAAMKKHGIGDFAFGLVNTKAGAVLYNSYVHPDEGEIIQKADEERLGIELGYGIASKPDWARPENRESMMAKLQAGDQDALAQVQSGVAIVLQSPGGMEKAAVIATPETEQQVTSALSALADPHDVLVRKSPARLIAHRANRRRRLQNALQRKAEGMDLVTQKVIAQQQTPLTPSVDEEQLEKMSAEQRAAHENEVLAAKADALAKIGEGKSEGEGQIQEPATTQAPLPQEPKKETLRRERPRETTAFHEQPLIFSLIEDFGGLISRSQAPRALGKERAKQNKSLWDDAPSLQHPTHNIIYQQKGITPDKMAQALYEKGLLNEPDVSLMWNEIAKASKTALSIAVNERALREQERETIEQERLFAEDVLTEPKEPRKSKSKRRINIAAGDLIEGESFTVGGEPLTVKSIGDEYVTLASAKWGNRNVDFNQSIWVDPPKKKTAPITSGEGMPEMPFDADAVGRGGGRARRGAKKATTPEQTDFLAGTKEEPFNLVGETAEERTAREAEAQRQQKLREQQEAEEASKEAEARQAKFDFFDADRVKPKQSAKTPAKNIDVETDWQQASEGDEAAHERLDDAKEARYGAPPTGRPGEEVGRRFSSSDDFAKFFERAWNEKDFDAFLEALKLTDRAIYGPVLKKLFAAAKQGDTEAGEKADWFRHVFSGTRPANATPPKQKPPTTTSATAPPSGETASTAPPPPPKPPPPPPPRPPRPPDQTPLSIPAMVRLAQALGSLPKIGLRLRRLIRGGFSRETNAILLQKTIFQNPAQAAKTLAHEIGHFIDKIGQGLGSGYLTFKLAPLGKWNQVFGNLWNWAKLNPEERQKYNFTPIERILFEEAVKLSKEWRGDFNVEKDRYRASGHELYADFMSALMNDPEWTFNTAPNLSFYFFEALDQKLEVKNAWFLLQDLLRNEALMPLLEKERHEGSDEKIIEFVNSIEQRHKDETWLERSGEYLYGNLLNPYGPLAMKAAHQSKNPIVRKIAKVFPIRYFQTMWERVTKNFGDDFVSRMEDNMLFFSKRIAWLDSELKRRVYLPLKAIGVSAKKLGDFMMFNRIINDATWTGRHYKANPGLFRTFLKWLANEAGWRDLQTTNGKGIEYDYSDAGIDAIPDDQLMDRGAALFRFMHEQTDPVLWDKVIRAASRRGAPPFAAKAMLMFNVSSYQANPQGFTPETARKELERMARELGDARFNDLQRAATDFYNIAAEITREARELGLFKDSMWNEIIAPNLFTYAPWMVLDYFTGHVSASIKTKEGTFKTILQPDLAFRLKLAALLYRMQAQKNALMIKSWFQTEGVQYGFANQMTIVDKLTPEKKREIEKAGGSAIGFWDRGFYRFLIIDDASAVSYFNRFNPDDLNPLLEIARKNDWMWRGLFTAWSIGFQINNAKRQIRTTFHRFGFKTMAQVGWDFLNGVSYPIRQKIMRIAKGDPEYTLASSIAVEWANAVFGEPMTPAVAFLVKEGTLPAPEASMSGALYKMQFIEAVQAGLIPAHMLGKAAQIHLTNGVLVKLRKGLGPLSYVINKTLNGIAWASAIVESSPKIRGREHMGQKDLRLKAAGKKGFTRAEKIAIAKLEAIPNPLVTSKSISGMGLVFTFYRTHINGIRAARTRAVHPGTRAGFLTRLIIDHIVWKSLYALSAIGVIDQLFDWFGGDDDKDKDKKPQVDYQEWAKRASPYKVERDDELFFGWISNEDDGPLVGSPWEDVPFFGQIAKRWHPPWGHSEIPARWTPIAFRISFSEEGRIMAPATYELVNQAFGTGMGAKRGEEAAKWAGIAGDYLIPTFNPVLKYAGYGAGILGDEPPEDRFRHRPIGDPRLWRVGEGALGLGNLEERGEIILGDLAGELGIPGFRARKENEDLPPNLRSLMEIPGMDRIIALDNYHMVREDRSIIKDDQKISDIASLQRGKDTERAVSRMVFLQNKGKERRDSGENAEYETLRQWYNKYYQGSTNYPGLYDVMKAWATAKYERNKELEPKLKPEMEFASGMLEETAKEANRFSIEARHTGKKPPPTGKRTRSMRDEFFRQFPEFEKIAPPTTPIKPRIRKSDGDGSSTGLGF